MKELLGIIANFEVIVDIKHVINKSGISCFIFKFNKDNKQFVLTITDYEFFKTPENLLVDYIYEILKENFNLE